MPSPVLQIEHLNLVTSNGPLSTDLSFEINKGEIITLTGKSGSGKTSLAMAIMGLLPAGVKMAAGQIKFFHPEGNIFMLPSDMGRWHILRGSHLGFIQQDVFGAFDPVIRMGKQLLMIVTERSDEPVATLETRLRKRMIDVGLADTDRIWNSYPHQLSGGQLQRCLLCISLVIKPALIIADEPTSAIDKSLQKELLDVFKFVRNELNTAILCITHDPFVVEYLSDRTISIDQGKISSSKREIVLDESTAGNSIFEVRGLGFEHKYGGVIERKGAVIHDLNFQIYKKQSAGIVGASGSGKSTLAQLLVGLLTPSKGHVYIGNQKIDYSSAKSLRYLRSKVQLVMQDGRGSLHPYKTIGQILHEVRRSMTFDRTRKFDPEVNLAEVELPAHIMERRPDQLSGGECLRVSIVRALMLEPEILICDESTSALDGITRDGILHLLRSLMERRDMSLVLITHDPDVIRRITNYVLVFDKGTIVEQGDTKKVVEEPQHPAAKNIFSLDATIDGKRNLLN